RCGARSAGGRRDPRTGLPRTTGDGRNDRDLVGVLHRRVEVLEEADVLVVGEDVDEASDLPALVADALLGAGVLRLEARDEGADGAAGRGDLLLALCQLAKRRGNTDRRHFISLLFRSRSSEAGQSLPGAAR